MDDLDRSIWVEDIDDNNVKINGHKITVPNESKFGRVIGSGQAQHTKVGLVCSYGQNTGTVSDTLFGFDLRRIDAPDVDKMGFWHD